MGAEPLAAFFDNSLLDPLVLLGRLGVWSKTHRARAAGAVAEYRLGPFEDPCLPCDGHHLAPSPQILPETAVIRPQDRHALPVASPVALR